MNTINGEYQTELVINKSTFIGYLKGVNTVEEAKDYMRQIRLIHPDATHHVSAYTIGKTGEYGHYSDDGEPSGTAGLPVLDVFRKNNLTNFVCVVVRYFGGIKLGAGGLVRAYSKTASAVLSSALIVPIIEYTSLQLTFNYPLLDIIENRLKNYNVTFLNRAFSNMVELTIKLPVHEKDLIISNLMHLTNGLIKITSLNE